MNPYSEISLFFIQNLTILPTAQSSQLFFVFSESSRTFVYCRTATIALIV